MYFAGGERKKRTTYLTKMKAAACISQEVGDIYPHGGTVTAEIGYAYRRDDVVVNDEISYVIIVVVVAVVIVIVIVGRRE